MGVYKRGGNWWIDYYFQGRRKREKVGPSKTQAKIVLQKRKIEIAEGKFLDVKREEKVKFENFAKTYLENYSKPNKKSWGRDVASLKNLLTFFKDKYLYEINPLDIESYKRLRKERVSPATVNREIACLKTRFNVAIRWKIVSENPAREVKLFPEKNYRIRYLEKNEIRNLCFSSPEPLRTVIIVALNTGMRQGEIINLRWQDVDFERRIIYLLETKSGEKREVPMNQAVYNVLLEIRRQPNSPYIFSTKEGKRYSQSWVQHTFHKIIKKLGIKDFRFHDLRHTFASQLVMMGIDIKTVQELLGHKKIDMTLRYAHLSPDFKKKAVDIFYDRMDTIWTPEQKKEKLPKEELSENIDVVKVLELERSHSPVECGGLLIH